MPTSPFWTIGCLSGAAAVGLGAFGAHGLRARDPPLAPRALETWGTAAQYQLVHSVVLLVADASSRQLQPPPPRYGVVAKSLLTAGMLGFSGSLYCLVLDRERFGWMGPVTPVGGACLIAGWVALGLGTRGRAWR